MKTLITLAEGISPDFNWLKRAYDADDFWAELFKDIETQEVILPSGTTLFHGTTSSWNPKKIEGPAWFGDFTLAKDYATSVFYYEEPVIHEYVTTRPYRLLLTNGEIGRRMMALLDVGEIITKDLAESVIENGYEGWKEPDTNGEIMLGDTSGLRYVRSLKDKLPFRK